MLCIRNFSSQLHSTLSLPTPFVVKPSGITEDGHCVSLGSPHATRVASYSSDVTRKLSTQTKIAGRWSNRLGCGPVALTFPVKVTVHHSI